MSDLAEAVLAGDARSAARLISRLEAQDPEASATVSALFSSTGSALTVGVTGPPGAGKSTLVKALIEAFRDRELRVGVLAVDPSSQLNGGALLGDRLRMMSPGCREQVFIRSMAVRGEAGGVALATAQAMRVLDAMGCDRVVVETVGVGQSEIAVAALVDCTLLVTHPGAGDQLQAMKSGIMEIGDLYVVNKADQPGAEQLVRQLTSGVRLLPRTQPDRQVLSVSARTGEGIATLVQVLEARLQTLTQTGALHQRRLRNLQREAFQLVVSGALRDVLVALGPDPTAPYVEDLAERRLDPAQVAARVLRVAVGGAKGGRSDCLSRTHVTPRP